MLGISKCCSTARYLSLTMNSKKVDMRWFFFVHVKLKASSQILSQLAWKRYPIYREETRMCIWLNILTPLIASLSSVFQYLIHFLVELWLLSISSISWYIASCWMVQREKSFPLVRLILLRCENGRLIIVGNMGEVITATAPKAWAIGNANDSYYSPWNPERILLSKRFSSLWCRSFPGSE